MTENLFPEAAGKDIISSKYIWNGHGKEGFYHALFFVDRQPPLPRQTTNMIRAEITFSTR